MAEQQTGTFVNIEWKSRKGTVRSCPQCGQGMVPVSVGSVALDRCVSHGIWFDPEELSAVLQRASTLSVKDGFDAPRDGDDAPPSGKRVEWTRVADDDHSTTGSLGTFVGSLFLTRR